MTDQFFLEKELVLRHGKKEEWRLSGKKERDGSHENNKKSWTVLM